MGTSGRGRRSAEYVSDHDRDQARDREREQISDHWHLRHEIKSRQTADEAIVSGANHIPRQHQGAAAANGYIRQCREPARSRRPANTLNLNDAQLCTERAAAATSEWKMLAREGAHNCIRANKKPARDLSRCGPQHIDDDFNDAIMPVICPTCQTVSKSLSSTRHHAKRDQSPNAGQQKARCQFPGAGCIVLATMPICT